MAKKQFKTESKKLLDMMVNSIYTHKEIFLRELISNASDAIDKLYFRSLTDDSITLLQSDYEIRITVDKDARLLTISDNGCGMGKDELENNLGTIAKSGSFDFKNNPENANGEHIDIIGQFGVGFYSAFMVADKIVVDSRAYGADVAYRWQSSGADGYTIAECSKENAGTVITLHIKEDTEDEKYSDYLEQYTLKSLVKKYSDYIRYPIRMMTEQSRLKEGSESEYETVTQDETLNSMVPIWKRASGKVEDEEYTRFYQEKFFDFEAPLRVIKQKAEGTSNFEALMFIPARAPFDFYSKDYEKGLQLYSSGVLIMDRCKDLLPDYFSFVKGLVDSSDLSLNISREMLQQDRQLRIIAKAIEKKITNELSKMLENDREKYEQFFAVFGSQLKWGMYADYGKSKDALKDLVLFKSSADEKYITLKEYVARMKDGQDAIYYASGESTSRIALIPQVESVVAHGYEVLYLTEDIDEFALQMLSSYDEKSFVNVCNETLDLSNEEEKESLRKENESAADMFAFIKESLGDAVSRVQFTNTLQEHAVCLSNEGALSVGMEKVLSRMPGAEAGMLKAEIVLEINVNHPIAQKLKALFADDKEKLAVYSKILLAQARLINGITIDNPAEISDLVCNLMI
ncbi:MAG: molecular chaperone HtpG [Oscillospiraceae bacterium]|nr:molecular chaperone HtpG [Oscillospiraceae bacterium]